MEIRSSTLDAIGNTPLIKLRKASEETGCTILGKAEFMNPGSSVKDRAALEIVTDAIEKGQLRPGGLIVEGTAGNTGIGLTAGRQCARHASVIVIPETQSQEKKDALRSLGATLVEVPAVPYRNPNNYVKVVRSHGRAPRREHPGGAIFANQFDNVANRDIHIRTTGPEIWEQTAGKVDGFICAVGTGGTLAGVAAALQRTQEGRHHRHCRSARRGSLQLLHDRRTQGRRQLDHRGDRSRAGHRQPRRTERRRSLFQIPDAETWRSRTDCSATKASASACRRA